MAEFKQGLGGSKDRFTTLTSVALGASSHVPQEEIMGILVVGSASREYGDDLSDFDVEVIVSDTFYRGLSKECRFMSREIDQLRVEYLILPEADFVAKVKSPIDIDHWPYEYCLVAYDPRSFLAHILPLIVRMPEEVRSARLKLHYFEFLFGAQRMSRLLRRGSELNARLVAAQTVSVLIKLLFVLRRRWPPVSHWATQNLVLMDGVSHRLKLMMTEFIRQPATAVAEALIAEIDSLMTEEGFDYALAKRALAAEVGGADFRDVRERFGRL
jgi:predicted nucleotidyltransferase